MGCRRENRPVSILQRDNKGCYVEIPIGVSSSENAAPCGSFSELDLPGISSVASPFGTYRPVTLFFLSPSQIQNICML